MLLLGVENAGSWSLKKEAFDLGSLEESIPHHTLAAAPDERASPLTRRPKLDTVLNIAAIFTAGGKKRFSEWVAAAKSRRPWHQTLAAWKINSLTSLKRTIELHKEPSVVRGHQIQLVWKHTCDNRCSTTTSPSSEEVHQSA